MARLTAARDAFFRKHFIGVATFASDLVDAALTTAEQKQLAELLGKLLADGKPSGGPPG
jgi:hypothetical protein